ncbi:four-carbon acid sugar kinase family protein [Acidisoma cellulosilytica]|uniref:3-oxo-tetronate kinase n=1 Tax=Acidisoma cellulosilyticum TaxID=2802395 RepID=A0A963Z723_9PROT|nr:3-oxo-tetronate kinase [Acidisoma cellulosilyticum]MCB8883776.1 four-carbon acid sugar kinase family protein [Acidisoma cellulosilyticum]
MTARPPSSVILGAIGDDFTGAVELAGMLTAGGARTLLVTSVADIPSQLVAIDAVVMALRSRVAPASEALHEIGRAAAAFQALDVRQIFFKYCATFDSTDDGNIGNCAELLMAHTDARSVLFCPSFPEAGRTVYQGHHFVGDQLLENSPKRLDPLTPMTRSDLMAVLAPQTAKTVGLLPWATVQAGEAAVRAYAAARAAAGVPFLIVDALNENDLRAIAAATWDWPLMTGGSSVAAYFPAQWRANGLVADNPAPRPERIRGAAAVLAGSCADRTREQIDAFAQNHPMLTLDLKADEDATIAAALSWAHRIGPSVPICIASSSGPEAVAEVQARFGVIAAGRRAERLLGKIAIGLVDLGVRRFLVAGGETSGAVIQALGISQLRVAPYAGLGVGRCMADHPSRLSFCLKSGKLGDIDMFARVLTEMGDEA